MLKVRVLIYGLTPEAPVPVPSGTSALNGCNGANPDGGWPRWVVDSADDGPGASASWVIEITA